MEIIMENKYVCESCVFSTHYKNVYDKHLLSKKHKEKQNNETAIKYSHVCNHCRRSYTTTSGLWKHEKKCTKTTNQEQQVLKIDEKEEEPVLKTDEKQEDQVLKEDEQKEEPKQKQEEKKEEEYDIQARIKLKIIKILLDHVDRDELNKIIDEIYDKK